MCNETPSCSHGTCLTGSVSIEAAEGKCRVKGFCFSRHNRSKTASVPVEEEAKKNKAFARVIVNDELIIRLTLERKE